MRFRAGWVWAPCGLALALSACGGAAPGVGPAKQPGESVDSLARDLESAERDLQANLGPTPATTSTAPMPSGGAAPGVEAEPPPAEPSTPPPATKSAEPAPAPPTPTEANASPCFTACRALASMHRSADRICELAGSDSERCTWARQKVQDADKRVEGAGCHC